MTSDWNLNSSQADSPLRLAPCAILCLGWLLCAATPAAAQEEQADPTVAESGSAYSQTPVGQVLLEELRIRRTALERLFAMRTQLDFALHELQTLEQQKHRMDLEEEVAKIQARLDRQDKQIEDILVPLNPVVRIVRFAGDRSARAVVEVKTEAGNKKELPIRVGSIIRYGADAWLVVHLSQARGIQFLHAESNTLQTISDSGRG